MNVTVVTEQVRSWFGWDLAELEKQVASVPTGADGVSFLPYLNGERTPNLPNGTGVLHGLGGSSASPAHLARAAMEGATLGLAYGLLRFDALGLTPSEIRLTGGGSQSAIWRQISADVFGVPVVGLATAEGARLHTPMGRGVMKNFVVVSFHSMTRHAANRMRKPQNSIATNWIARSN
jgi:xylulokinase